jgi:uncharacterized protein (TIGR00369 family)
MAPFEPEYLAALTDVFERRIVFNQALGLQITHIAPERVVGRIAMQPQLVGHFAHNRVHGGVISAGLDAMGALAVMAALGARHRADSVQERLDRFNRLGTIDLRVDYLRPGTGEAFELSAEVLRLGSRVACTRMEFRGAGGVLLSCANAAYMVS